MVAFIYVPYTITKTILIVLLKIINKIQLIKAACVVIFNITMKSICSLIFFVFVCFRGNLLL